MTDDPGYRSGGTRGGRCGCAAAAISVLLTSAPFILGAIFGDCASEEDCRIAGRDWVLPAQLAALTALGALLGFSVRSSVNWLALRRRDPREAGPPPLCSLAGMLALGGAVLWVVVDFWVLMRW
ncbi:MAG TPA: hypothetical protein VEX35_01830 [Allosphingosinicella sp.]|nr:hypothetical protein [Allosphingosinicella sp.]